MALSFQGAPCPPDSMLMGVRWSVAYPSAIGMSKNCWRSGGSQATTRRSRAGWSKTVRCWKRRFIARKRPVGVSGRLDETYMQGKGQWYSLYRAVAKTGQPIAFLLPEQWDEQAATRFLTKASRRHGGPEKITLDGSAAKEAALKSYHEEPGTASASRQIQYLHNSVEQDQRGGKRVTRSMVGFKSFDAAPGTLVGIARMHMIKKQQRMGEAGDEGRTAAEPFYALAASSPHRQGLLPLS